MLKHSYKAAVLTASDKASAGLREDVSGPLIASILAGAGYEVVEQCILPDEREQLSGKMLAWCESGGVDLILTTGGTGLSKRDFMPEATLAIAHRQVPGIAEAVRAYSMSITRRGMLSRGVAVICRQTLIINLPGSPKAVEESLDFLRPELVHALDIMTGRGRECARTDKKQPPQKRGKAPQDSSK